MSKTAEEEEQEEDMDTKMWWLVQYQVNQDVFPHVSGIIMGDNAAADGLERYYRARRKKNVNKA
ncbi:hypothetical protein E2C01_072709 [Portunus trituberculatus]|uniref:Uncharacterized protein n=1 Tax=Portunus trituberculatus TaxID=210409 RepID=A0A5B7I8K9_PORTR|nr:hypothetical protein [Portunus trituberculatus]